jgi:GNAT superfamily N-acetyltransferase
MNATLPCMSDVRIRFAAAADAAKLSELKIDVWRETYEGLIPDRLLGSLDSSPHHDPAHWRGLLARPDRWTLVLEQDGRPAGFCHFGVNDGARPDHKGLVEALYLLPAAQGRGHGRRLMALAAEWLAGEGLVPVVVWLIDGNERAERFYRRLGARFLERRVAFEFEGRPIMELGFGWHDLTPLVGMKESRRP